LDSKIKLKDEELLTINSKCYKIEGGIPISNERNRYTLTPVPNSLEFIKNDY